MIPVSNSCVFVASSDIFPDWPWPFCINQLLGGGDFVCTPRESIPCLRTLCNLSFFALFPWIFLMFVIPCPEIPFFLFIFFLLCILQASVLVISLHSCWSHVYAPLFYILFYTLLSVFTLSFWSFLITALERLDITVLFPFYFLDLTLLFEFQITVTALVSRFLLLILVSYWHSCPDSRLGTVSCLRLDVRKSGPLYVHVHG